MDDLVRWITPSLDDADRAYWLRMIHATVGWLILITFWATDNQTIRILLLCLMCIVFFVQLACRGCPLTRLEKRLDPSRNLTVVDPIVLLLGLPRKNWARMTITIFLSCLYILGMLYGC